MLREVFRVISLFNTLFVNVSGRLLDIVGMFLESTPSSSTYKKTLAADWEIQ